MMYPPFTWKHCGIVCFKHDVIYSIQAECEELGQRADALKSENSSLRVELERIKKEYDELVKKNASLKVDK